MPGVKLYDTLSVHNWIPGNDLPQTDLYQLFTYAEIIKNKRNIENVSLALLYPKTDKFNETKNWTYFNGTKISIVPVDVLDFENNRNLLSIL